MSTTFPLFTNFSPHSQSVLHSYNPLPNSTNLQLGFINHSIPPLNTQPMALQLRLKPFSHIRNPTSLSLSLSLHHFSSSSNDDDKPKPKLSSSLSDLKSFLKNPTPQKPTFQSPPSSFSPLTPSKDSSLEEIRKNLSEYRRRSSPPLPPPPQSSSPISFQELYHRNPPQNGNPGPGPGTNNNSLPPGGRGKLDAIRESLRRIKFQNQSQNPRGGPNDRMNRTTLDPFSLEKYKNSFKIKPKEDGMQGSSSIVLGGSEMQSLKLPGSFFRKEVVPKVGNGEEGTETQLVKNYSYEELGDGLRKLRPEVKGGFSLRELNERLKKLAVVEEKEMESRGVMRGMFKDLRHSFEKMGENKTRVSMQKLNILDHITGTSSFMQSPPKEQLVEKYFHPDNLSSEEKMKLELKKVRDEFKMSESDCGSSRVQIAQLTTKIKHLSSVLHKKDKHSRKGLVAMVQRRKKLLKYLRRTDWESYCFVISKLGLRDNPDYKQ